MIQEAEFYQNLHTCTHISGVFGIFEIYDAHIRLYRFYQSLIDFLNRWWIPDKAECLPCTQYCVYLLFRRFH